MADMETDYLIVGAGAVGLAFADTLVAEDPDCTVTIVDRHAKPGGHWNDAYGFVALHQPSANYGVNSLAFPNEHIDTHGPNKGLFALASGSEVLAYFETVMSARLLPTGRVTYLPSHDFGGMDEDRRATVRPLFSGEEKTIKVRRKLVDATFYQTSVPSTHKRQFEVADGVDIAPPGGLLELWKRAEQPEHFVILGAGKTAMDTGVWLIENGVAPENISWVRPRESWLWNRKYTQPGADNLETSMSMQIAILEAAGQAQDGAELMRILGEQGYYLRIDESVEPEMFHFATISQGEVDILRKIENVIRMGRVTAIAPGKLVFAAGEAEVPRASLFIDCTASAVPLDVRRSKRPIFDGDTITLQPLHVPVVTFSAALAAFLETAFETDEEKNRFAMPGPLTDSPATFPYAQLVTMMNRGAWAQSPEIGKYLSQSRLDFGGPTLARLIAEGSPKLAVLGKFQQAIARHMPDLIRLGMQAKALHEQS
ncbi:NAD(P)-binding protein [Qipengyuania sp. 1NDH17]|uniref:NAD(P)-binding protein n=1 Tax=Qipengyuania polymorpha TaxID=2867234 RepID=A0ABS7J140_9SPHN|nr:NAD(P)-binding protein [Qipengyuania polymorpha]MBX7459059.1 NAD(P)-binding protein [Qipengyuania polymorpha]